MAVVGTGKLGILIAQALVAVGGVRVTAFGRRDANFRPSPPRTLPPSDSSSLPPSLPPCRLDPKTGDRLQTPIRTLVHVYVSMHT